MKVRTRCFGALLVVAVLAAACGGSDDGGDAGDGAATPDSGGSEALTASDVGVTEDAVEVGVLLTDVSQTKQLLGEGIGLDLDEQESIYRAFFDEVNEDGGIAGRTLTPVFTTFDPVAGDALAACTELTEDEEVFAVLAMGIYGPPVLCVTQQHGTPLLNTGGFINEYYEKSDGLLFTTQPSKPRSARNTIAAMEQEGLLEGTTIGVYTSQAGDDNVAVKTALVPTLEELGHEVARVGDLAADTGAAIGQIPVEVTAMREAGVDLVFLSTNVFFSSQFVEQADEQGYRPLYALSDADDNVTDFFLSRMPESFTSVAFTTKRVGEHRDETPEPPADAACRTTAGGTVERGTVAYETVMNVCNQVRLFAEAAEAAGGTLTRGGWAEAMQEIDDVPSAYGEAGSFSATKFDAGDFIRKVEADMACACWKPAGEYDRMRY